MDNSDILVLVVDDDPDILFANVRILKKEGYEVLGVETGGECLEKTAEKHPDLILLDVQLPDIPGTEVCLRLKNNPDHPKNYIMMMSGKKISTHDQADGLDAGADGYIARPVSNRELISRVAAMVRLIRAERKCDRYVSELEQAEEQLQSLNNELEQRVERRSRELEIAQSQYLHAVKLSAIGQLAASIAHEFNNPLQGLRTILKGLKRRAILDEEDKELLDLAISENERMKNLIIGLQDFNRPSAGKKMAMDVHAALDYLLLLYKSDFNRKKISTVRKYAEGFPPVTVIPDQLKQVFLNLLNNATDACSEKGGLITITTCHDNQKVAIAIEDTGEGFKLDMKNKIFEPFFTTKTKEKGTGLGLSICRDIIQHHQGEIRVESQPGKGSTFTILLPAI